MLHLTVHQDNKELFGASFSILSDSEECLGKVFLQGRLGSIDVLFQIDYQGQSIIMQPARKTIVRKALNRDIFHVPFRPYSFSSDKSSGWIYNDKVKLEKGSTRCHILNINGSEYCMYLVGLGENGTCAPVYFYEHPIGHIESGCIAQRDLHDFSVCLYDEQNNEQLLALLALTCYRYLLAFYKSGEVMSSGMVKKVYTTTNPLVLEKVQYLGKLQ